MLAYADTEKEFAKLSRRIQFNGKNIMQVHPIATIALKSDIQLKISMQSAPFPIFVPFMLKQMIFFVCFLFTLPLMRLHMSLLRIYQGFQKS